MSYNYDIAAAQPPHEQDRQNAHFEPQGTMLHAALIPCPVLARQKEPFKAFVADSSHMIM